MIKKLVIILVLFMSLSSCSFEKYTEESMEYKTILPSISEDDSYEVIGVTETEVFVTHYHPSCIMLKEEVVIDGVKELQDKNVCTNYVHKIYAIDIETKGYREIEQSIQGYYVSQFIPVTDSLFAYQILQYDPITEYLYEYTYFDNLDMTNMLIEDKEFIYESNKYTTVMNIEDGVVYFGCVDDQDLHLYSLYDNGSFSKKLLFDNGTRGRMYGSLYIQCETETGTEIYSIEDDKWFVFNESITDAAIYLSDTISYFVSEDGVYSYNLQTKEKVKIDKHLVSYFNNYMVFDEEIWVMDNGKYKSLDAEIDLNIYEGFKVNDSMFAYEYEDRIDIYTIK